MRSVQPAYDLKPSSLSPEILQTRLDREREGRHQAEELLESKSRELFYLNNSLKVTAASLERQRSQLDAILNHTQAGIVFSRRNLSIRRANLAALSMFGLDDETTSTASMEHLVTDLGLLTNLVESSLAEDQPQSTRLVEAVGKSLLGFEFPMEIGVTSLEHEGSVHLVWIIRDISRRKKEEERHEALERELQQAQKLEALGTLASGVAHELNTPIQYISDNVRFLQDAFDDLHGLVNLVKTQLDNAPQDLGDLSTRFEDKVNDIDLDFLFEETPEAIKQSLHGLEQAASIVKAIKNFSHPGDADIKPIDLNQAIETTLTVTRNQWKYVADVETCFDEKLPPIECRAEDINQIFVNLVVNAADAIEEMEGNEQGRILISTHSDGNYAIIEVSDSGPGVPDDVLEKIFDPFFTTKDVGKGSGQGLAICYSIITQKYGGTITCESQDGKGADFIIRLPLKVNN